MISLNNGLTYVPVKINGNLLNEDIFIKHLNSAYNQSDKLSKNYTLEAINRMFEYGYVYNSNPTDLVYMTGIENFGNNIYRIESRLYTAPKYRKKIWTSPDNYETVIHQISNLPDNVAMLFKSRETNNPAGVMHCKKIHVFFKDWQLFPEKIELKYVNNWQWIFYNNLKGNVDENIEKLRYKI